MMTMDPFTGHIKAWVGGLDFKYFKYDHVKQGSVSPVQLSNLLYILLLLMVKRSFSVLYNEG
jgi:membrane carboxypeptidase/penicillin-binding protein